MQKVNYVMFLFLICVGWVKAQENDNKVLAKIGNQDFTVDEFIERYEVIPKLTQGKQQDEMAFRNQEFYTIVAEKLWSLYALELGYDTSDVMKYTYKSLEKMYVRDALFKREIESKAKVDEKSYQAAYSKIIRKLFVNFVFAKDEKEINGLYKLLKDGEPFDSILSKRIDSKYQTAPIEVVFGMMQEDIEDALFNLPVGGYTAPINYKDEWYIFRLTNEAKVNFKDSEAFQKEANNAKKLVEERALDKSYQQFFNKFFKGKQVNADGYLFWSIADKIIDVLHQTKKQNNIPDGEKINLAAEDYTKIETSLTPDTLKMVFVKFDENPVTVFQFLREFFYEGFYAISANADTIRLQLQSRVKRFIENEMLAREGYKQGLQNLPEVKKSIDMWRENFLAKLVKNNFIDETKLSENELKDYYEKNKENISSPLMVNILEILTDNLDDIEKVMKELDKGTDFRELAKKYTKRAWTKENGGEFGFFAANMYGEIGSIAANMKIGEIYGPIKLKEGYSIFKLIDKKEVKNDIIKPFEEIKDSLRSVVRVEKLKNKMVEKTVELAKKYGVKVNENVLYNLKVENLNMLVYRMMGFGGRILAVPVDPIFVDWVEVWKKNEDSLP